VLDGWVFAVACFAGLGNGGKGGEGYGAMSVAVTLQEKECEGVQNETRRYGRWERGRASLTGLPV
jgi:hypothetical protein